MVYNSEHKELAWNRALALALFKGAGVIQEVRRACWKDMLPGDPLPWPGCWNARRTSPPFGTSPSETCSTARRTIVISKRQQDNIRR